VDERIRRIANQLGAEIVAELPDVGHGALAAAHYAQFYRKRMQEIRAQIGDKEAKSRQLQIAMDDATLRALETISELLWPGKNIGAAAFASGLLKGMSIVILDQLIKQLESDREATQKNLNAKAALLAAVEEILEHPAGRQAAG